MNRSNSKPGQGKDINGRIRSLYAISAQEALHRLIVSENIKREWLAHVLELSPQLLCKYENGTAPLPMDVAAQIDNICRTTTFSDLFDAMTGRWAS